MIRIGDFSKMTKTTVKALRYYDETGLLAPAFVDPDTGYRYYTTDQLLPLRQIVALRQIGLSIPEIAAVLSGQDDGFAREVLARREKEIEAGILDARRQLSRVRTMLSNKKEELLMQYQAIVKTLPACTVYYKQGVVPTFADYGAFILQSAEECRAANPDIRCAEPDYCYVTYLDNEYRETDITIEYAQAVTAAGKETDTIRFRRDEEKTAICVYHKGPYDGLRDAYTFAYNWLKDNGYVPAGSAREQYIDGVWNKETPDEWLTEIQIPAERK